MTVHEVMASKTTRLLYCEDNDLVREVTVELLTRDDRVIVAVATAEQALAAYEQQPFDAVITDVSLPVMSGLDLARTLLARNPRLPLIVATGYALNFQVESMGPRVRTIIKPFDGARIDALLDEVLSP